MKDLFSLKNKVVVITGASGLLGVQHAEAVASYGGNCVLLDLNEDKLNTQKEKLEKDFGIDCLSVVCDITNEKSVESTCKIIINKFSRIDALVNNAANNPKVEDVGGMNFSRLENFPMEIWLQDIAVGLTGSYLCARFFGYEMSKNASGGVIINVSSDLGLIAPDQRLYMKAGLAEEQQPVKPVTYSVVKSGLIGLTRYLATYWAHKNVRCNAICPGGVENNQNEEFLNEVRARIPLNRMAKPNEYQGLLVFLLSDSASYMNGSVIAADGGRSTW